MELGDAALTESNSYTDGLADTQSRFFVVPENSGSASSSINNSRNRKTIVVKDAFKAGYSGNGKDFWPKETFQVTIAGITSPRSTAPTLSFKSRINTADGYTEYKKEQGVYSNVYQANTFSIANIQRDNEMNGIEACYYNFTV